MCLSSPFCPMEIPGSGCQGALRLPLQFLCCGKSSPSSLLGPAEADLCPGEEGASQVRGGAAAGRPAHRRAGEGCK